MMGAKSIILLTNAICLIWAVTATVILTTTDTSPPQTCEYNGKEYPLDSEITIDDCIFGYCDDNGYVFYMPECCGPVECPNPMREEGQCCPVCEKKYCEYEGEFYEVGLETNIDPNTTLVCTDPYSYCLKTTSCETNDTEHPAPPGESCSICQEWLPDPLVC